jgi:aminoglycoside phosphotransferase (APT) family kinase protein
VRVAEEHPAGASPEQIEAAVRRAFGDHARVAGVSEIGIGTYNSTYRIDIARAEPVILRVAPDRATQSRSDLDAMRNEYAAAPYFACLGRLAPRILAVDFTGQVIPRDHMFQALLPGVPAVTGLDAYPRDRHAPYYRQLGEITRAIHDVPGDRFGRVAGPGFATWSEALTDQFLGMAADLADAGHDATEAHRMVAAVATHRDTLDEVTRPRLLHGDLWQLNILVDPDAPAPTITGVLDYDAARWGDPLADWTIHRVRQQPGPEAGAFWEAYGPPPAGPASEVRELVYRARNLLGARLDIHRRGLDLAGIPAVHWDLGEVLTGLGA